MGWLGFAQTTGRERHDGLFDEVESHVLVRNNARPIERPEQVTEILEMAW
jgi:hypothetical protein